MRLCIWYPANEKGTKMKLSDYAGIASLGGSQDKSELHSELKRTTEMIFDLESSAIPQKEFDAALGAETWAMKDVKMEAGKWPLIVSDTEPVSMLVTNEWLASHGWIVAVPAVQYPYTGNDKTLYEGPTRGLEFLIQYMSGQAYVDTTEIQALGFGGGTLASFFAVMRGNKIRSMVSIEGGLFMPETKTTFSADYAPLHFNVPLLHIVNPAIVQKENPDEFNAIVSPKYRLVEQAKLAHHDFTIYGRILNGLLQRRGKDAGLADKVFAELHEQVLYFFINERPKEGETSTPAYFNLEKFN